LRLASVTVADQNRVAVQIEGGTSLLPDRLWGSPLRSVDDLLAALEARGGWPALAPDLRAGAEPLPAGAEFKFRPVVTRPEKIFCIGLNYRRHAAETGADVPSQPIVFSKFSNALAGHGDTVPLPAASTQVDYEAELVIVVGRTAHNLPESRALECVAGYTAGNDISARDLQAATGQWLLGKSCDRFGPIGPWLVTSDELPRADGLTIEMVRGDAVVQHSSTSDMIFSCAQILSHLSRVWTLRPGDVVFTGTPEGVIVGQPAERRRWLGPGERTVVRIERIGELENRFA
jgi:2-keto-4-pentenoate hydratase/2-oxohepta-3-ene-1,7-dioic acid hydratase in catechol pathway